MKSKLFSATLIAVSFAHAAWAADVGVVLSIGQPGFYGQLDIGDYPRPTLIYSQPRVMDERAMHSQPIYLHVPPGHAKNWRKHCHEYNACDEQVYFVQDSWYNREYVPRYQEQQREHRNERRDEGHDRHDKGHGRDR
jgi:hypothetical protein